MASPLNIALILRLVDKMTGPAKRITNNFAGIRKGWSQMQKQFRTAADMRQAAAGVASFARVARNAMLAPISASQDFGAEMSRVQGLTKTSGAEFAALRAKALELGSTIGEFSALDAAKGMSEFGVAGFETGQIIEALPTALNLSTAAQVSLADTIKITTGIMGGFGLKADQSARVGDVLAATFTGSKTTLQSLGETFQYVGPVARAAGLSLEQTAVIAGVLGNSSIEASRGGTALTAILMRLSGARRGPGSKMLKEMKIELDEVVNGIKVARDPLKVMADIGEKIGGLGGRKQLGLMGRIFGAEGAASAVVMMKAFADVRTKNLTDDVNTAGGSLDKLTKIMRDNAANAAKEMTSALDTLSINVGDTLAPEITSLTKSITGLLSSMNTWVGENPRLTKAIFATVGVVTLLATALAGVMFTMAALTSAKGLALLAKGFVVDLIPAIIATTKAFIGLSVSLLTNPIFLVAAAVVVLATAATLLFIYWDEFAAWWGNMWQKFKEAPLIVKYILGGLLAPLLLLYAPIILLVGLARKIVDNWGPIKNWFAELWDGIGSGASGLWERIKTGASDVLGWIMDKIRSALDVLSPLLAMADTTIGKAVLAPFTGLPALAGFAGDVATETVGVLDPRVSSQEKEANLRIRIEGPGVIDEMSATGFNMEADTGPTMTGF